MAGSLSEFLVAQLKKIDPTAEYSGHLPKIQSSTGTTYFVKLGSSSEHEQYVGEAQSLEAIGIAAPGLAPKIFSYGKDEGGRPYFISEYKIIGGLSENAASTLATRLATELHQHRSQKGFGFGVPTFCGATKQKNGWYRTWEQCYDSLIGNLLEGLSKQGYDDLVKTGEEVREQYVKLLSLESDSLRLTRTDVGRIIPKLLGCLKVQPVLLHGDLWNGNVGIDSSTGRPVIFDPSSYYGHNEADLAIARIFGGFPQSFFVTYHKYHPKAEPISQYDLRGELYELYHYLNHTLLFGGGYSGSASRIMKKLLSEVPDL